MSQEKQSHTPGPWSFACDSGHSSPCLGKVRHSKKAVVYQNGATIASHVANWKDARLIAAAPELLSAARRGIAALEANGATNCEAAKELRRAIAKYEGEVA